MTAKKLSLGERIALAASGANQEDEFPEDIEYGDTSARVVDIDEDELEEKRPVRSSLRTKNVQLLEELDDRYSGSKVSRKKLTKADKLAGSKFLPKKGGSLSNTEDEGIEDFSDEEVNEDASGLEDDSFDEDDDQESVENEEEASGDESEGLTDEEEIDDSDLNSSAEEEEEAEEESQTVKTLSSRDHQAEVEKGKATLNQIRIWDSLLEVRIRLQKMLLDCNRLPKATSFEQVLDDIKQLDNGSATSSLVEKSQEAVKVLMHELLRLQSIMVQRNSEVNKSLGSKSAGNDATIVDDPMAEEIPSDTDEEGQEKDDQPQTTFKRKMDMDEVFRSAKRMKLEEFESSSADFFTKFIPYRNQIVQRWNDKTQFAGGKFNNKKANQQISTLRQIEQIISNKERLLKRTQVKRSNYSIIGEAKQEDTSTPQDDNNFDPEIFDDDDFYHQLLRDLIERKTSNVNDPIQLSQHWLDLQKLRSKLKRKVDTKASKGRKIRYDVHSKLVNFMAPQDSCSMSSAAVKELFASLFGKTIKNE